MTKHTKGNPFAVSLRRMLTRAMPGLSGTPLRLASAIPVALVTIYLIIGAPLRLFEGTVIAASMLGGYELNRMGKSSPKFSLLLALLSAFVTSNWLYALVAWKAVIAISLVVLLIVSISAPKPIEGATSRVGLAAFAPIYVGIPLAMIADLRAIEFGKLWIIMAMLIAFLGDTGAYFAGRAFGKHKLYELLSPKKTIEGAIGGLLSSTLVASLFCILLMPQTPWFVAAIIGLVGGTLGQAGDLFESLLKRSAGIKDSGRIMPGHGGLLDRIDGMIFSMLVVWFAQFGF